VCLCVLQVSAPALAGPPPPKPDVALEARFRTDLEKVSGDAAAAWDRGNAAREAQRLADAEAAYRDAIKLAPNVDHPHRRLCGVLLRMARLDDAVRECELALSLAPSSAYDKTAVAQALLARAKADDRDRAVSLAREGAQALPDDVYAVQVDCEARTLSFDVNDTSTCVDHLLTLAPDDLLGNAIAVQVALSRGDYHRANFHLKKAKDAGLPADVYDKLSALSAKVQARSEGAQWPVQDALIVGGGVLGGWLLLLAILLVAGHRLSQAELRRAESLEVDDAEGTPRERRLRRVYRLVLALTGLLFYLSLPFLIVVVVAASLLALAVFDEMGATPIIAIFAIIVVVATTVISVVRALFFSRFPKIEGTRIEPRSNPKLASLLDEVAEAIDTRPIDVVYLTPGAEAGVLEQRTLWRALRGARSERTLVLGVALFDGMKQHELRAILGHEYGHFRNADTGGGVALGVQRSLMTLLRGIGASGYALFNPAWWMLRAFTHLYLSVSSGASRLQERLADRWAIRAYGSAAFTAGLRHVITREVEYTVDLSNTLKEVIENKWSLPNFYQCEPEREKAASSIEVEVEKRMNRAPTLFDSHPSPRQRLEWADRLALPGDRSRADEPEPVWSLFPDPEKLEREMTALIRERVRVKLGVTVSDAEWDDKDDSDAEVEQSSD
jgi:Zn-dependent protease with chaperone function